MSLAGPHGVNISRADTEIKFKLGSRVLVAEGLFEYGQANGALTQYAWCKLDNDGQATELDTTVSGAEPTAVGIPQVALADNEYGWFFRGLGGGSGVGIKGLVAASCAADVKLYTTATAGVADDTATDLIQGVCLVSANGGSEAAVELYAVGIMMTNGQD